MRFGSPTFRPGLPSRGTFRPGNKSLRSPWKSGTSCELLQSWPWAFQDPNRTPANIRFNPTTKIGPKMSGAPKTPKMVLLVLTHSHLSHTKQTQHQNEPRTISNFVYPGFGGGSSAQISDPTVLLDKLGHVPRHVGREKESTRRKETDLPYGHGSKARTPSALKQVLKWVVHLPQNGTIGFDPQPYGLLTSPNCRAAAIEPFRPRCMSRRARIRT